MEIGDRIVKLREKRNWSQRELAKRAGLNYSVMNRIETGKRPLTDQEVNTFADLFDVTTDYLLGRSDKQEQLKVTVAGKEIELTPEEFKVFEELKKHSIAFHDLASDPERKVKQLIKMYEFIQKDLKELDEKLELGEDGFGQFED